MQPGGASPTRDLALRATGRVGLLTSGGQRRQGTMERPPYTTYPTPQHAYGQAPHRQRAVGSSVKAGVAARMG
jgi:hypothetical protein